jgi:hypothetical protein
MGSLFDDAQPSTTTWKRLGELCKDVSGVLAQGVPPSDTDKVTLQALLANSDLQTCSIFLFICYDYLRERGERCLPDLSQFITKLNHDRYPPSNWKGGLYGHWNRLAAFEDRLCQQQSLQGGNIDEEAIADIQSTAESLGGESERATGSVMSTKSSAVSETSATTYARSMYKMAKDELEKQSRTSAGSGARSSVNANNGWSGCAPS